jgi:hypothetical protein
MELNENTNILSFALTGTQTMSHYWSRLLFNRGFTSTSIIKSELSRIKSSLSMEGAINVLPTPNTAHLIILRFHAAVVVRQFLTKYNLTMYQYKYKKNDAIYLLYTYLFFSKFAIRIQRRIRKYQVRTFNQLHGPSFINRTNCINDEDFVTLQPIADVTPYELFTFYENTKIYAFTLLSFKELLLHSRESNPGTSEVCILNPYTRQPIPTNIIQNVLRIYKNGQNLFKLSYLSPDTIINDNAFRTTESIIRDKAASVFNRLRYYSNHEWFLSLTLDQLRHFTVELIDIWDFRSNLLSENKRAIYGRPGHPFSRIQSSVLFTPPGTLEYTQINILIELDSFLTACERTDNMNAAVIFILEALTLVSEDAANALPWLYALVNS